MKKVLIFALAAFAFVGCKKDDNEAPAPTQYKITVTGGTADKQTAVAGAVVTLTVGAVDPGNHLDKWTSDQVDEFAEVTKGVKYIFQMPAKDVTITATYALTTYNVEVVEGKAVVNGTELLPYQGVTMGTKVTLVPDRKAAHALTSFTSDDVTLVETDGVYSFVMVPKDVTVTANWERTYGPYLLYLNDEGKLSVGTWGLDVNSGNQIFTRFGSLVGLLAGQSTWALSDVVFNPRSNITFDTWMTAVSGSYVYTANRDIPYMGDFNPPKKTGSDSPTYNIADKTDWTANVEGFVTTNHTEAMIAGGKGDICKLVGLTAAEAQAMTAAQLAAHNSGYRLPRLEESAVGTYEVKVIEGQNGVWLAENASVETFFPMVGYRHFASTFQQPNAAGQYWTSASGINPKLDVMDNVNTPAKGAVWLINFTSNAKSSSEVRNAMPVRCVPDVAAAE